MNKTLHIHRYFVRKNIGDFVMRVYPNHIVLRPKQFPDVSIWSAMVKEMVLYYHIMLIVCNTEKLYWYWIKELTEQHGTTPEEISG
jgi:hypothetical protein